MLFDINSYITKFIQCRSQGSIFTENKQLQNKLIMYTIHMVK